MVCTLFFAFFSKKLKKSGTRFDDFGNIPDVRKTTIKHWEIQNELWKRM